MVAPVPVASAFRLLLLLLVEVTVLGTHDRDGSRPKGVVVKADEIDDVVMTAAIRATRSHRRLLRVGTDGCCCRRTILKEAASTLYTHCCHRKACLLIISVQQQANLVP
jgi:hypothetical protein